MDATMVRPSRAVYEASWPQRKRQALGIGGGAVVVFLVIALIGIVRQPSTAPIILLLIALAGLCAVGVFAIEFAYLRNAVIAVTPSGLRLSGVPLSRNRTSPVPAGYERATVDFGRGVQRRVWMALDASAKPLFWTYADFWDEADIERLAAATKSAMSGSWTSTVAKPAAPRW